MEGKDFQRKQCIHVISVSRQCGQSSVGLTDEVSKQTVSSSQDVHSDQPEIIPGPYCAY